METNIEILIRRVMKLKEIVGEFSVDLYYNDGDKEKPYTCKVRSVIDKEMNFHVRTTNFTYALIEAEIRIKMLNNIK